MYASADRIRCTLVGWTWKSIIHHHIKKQPRQWPNKKKIMIARWRRIMSNMWHFFLPWKQINDRNKYRWVIHAVPGPAGSPHVAVIVARVGTWPIMHEYRIQPVPDRIGLAHRHEWAQIQALGKADVPRHLAAMNPIPEKHRMKTLTFTQNSKQPPHFQTHSNFSKREVLLQLLTQNYYYNQI